MEEEQNPNTDQPVTTVSSPQDPNSSNRKMVILLSGFVAIAAVILAAAGYLYFRNSKPNYAYNNQYTAQGNPTASPAPTVSTAKQLSTISSKTDLDGVLNELSLTTDKELQNDYNQATAEGNNF